ANSGELPNATLDRTLIIRPTLCHFIMRRHPNYRRKEGSGSRLARRNRRLAGGDPIFGGLHCLVLDDEFLIALDVQHLLETAGAANVTCAGTVKEAMEALNG